MRKLHAFIVLTLLAVMLTGLVVFVAPTPFASATDDDTSDNGVTPILVDGNPSCADLDYDNGFKIDGWDYATFPTNGYLTFTLEDGTQNGFPTIVTSGPEDPYNTVSIRSSDGRYFDWMASLGIDAVIVKGGSDANAYVYVPEDTEDTGLTTPGASFDISHVEFCYDYELAAEKTANAEYTRTYTWDITKEFDATYDKFIGDSATHGYEVSVDQTVTDSDFAVSGEVMVSNPTPFTVSFSVSDSVNGTQAEISCPTYELAPNDGAPGGPDEVTCTYSADLGSKADGTNTATITSSNTDVKEATATADYVFGDPSSIVGYQEISVTDTNGPSWTATDSTKWTYSSNFVCSNNPGDYTNGFYTFDNLNTAKIVETGQTDDATVTVNCYAPVLEKDAEAGYDERHDWDIKKTVTPESQSAFVGESVEWTWIIDVIETIVDQNFAVTGNITVTNPAGSPGDISVELADELDDGTSATVDCGAGSTVSVAPGTYAVCSYSATPDDASATLNTATGSFNGIDFTATADVTFVKNVINDEATVNDPEAGLLNQSVSGDDQFTAKESDICSTDTADYGDNGQYDESVSNTATLTDEEGNQYQSLATTAYICYAPIPSKDANTSYVREFDWTITKEYDGTYDKFIGDPATTHDYKVSVDQTISEYDFTVAGTITVRNPNPDAAMTVSLSDFVDDVEATLDCDGTLKVPAGSSATCGYSAKLDSMMDGTNTATVTLNNVGFDATADYAFGDADITTVGKPNITVSDTNGESWTTNGDATWMYTRDFTCPTDLLLYKDGVYSFDHINTATINETGQSDDATVTVNCYVPEVDKTANGSFDRHWNWMIEKVGDQTDLTLKLGESFQVNYEVTVSATSTDSNYGVAGTITVKNYNPMAAMNVSIRDLVDGTPATLACDEGSLTVPAATNDGPGEATCDYSLDLGDNPSYLPTSNTATVTLNEIDFEATADVSFDLDQETDECIDIEDDQVGYLGKACAPESPKTFRYSILVGPYEVCGEYEFTNIASFVTNDTSAKGSDFWTVIVDVPCLTGCTLTQGYWKTHSERGPAPYDETWDKLDADEDGNYDGDSEPFFATGYDYYEIFQMAPKGGNAYIILAHQWIAAELNTLNGAYIPSDVEAAWNEAAALLETYASEVDIPKDTAPEDRARAIELAGILDMYNNGEIGPGYCTDVEP